MTKYKDKYYMQYGAPATEFSGYSDGVYVSKNPLEGYEYQQHNPFSYKQEVLREALDTAQLFRITSIIGGTFPRFKFQPKILKDDWESGQLDLTKMM